MRRVALALATLLAVLLASPPVEAARKALVIGNAAYKAQPLANPVNDATDMAARLKALGFEVVLATNATQRQMGAAILDFQKRIAPGDETVVFYAGHGVQVGGTNYLMPVDAEPTSEAEVEFVAIDLNKVIRVLGAIESNSNLLLLDACRNNPFEQKVRGGGRGLARLESASGTLISYAAAPGTVAADGQGRNSPYTRAVLAALDEPGLAVEDMLKRVHLSVREATGNRQTTWQEGQILGRMVLNAAPSQAGAPAPAPVPAFDPRLAEMKYWESVDRERTASAYQAYLDQYPQGTFVSLARARVAALMAVQPAAPTPVAPAAAPERDTETRFWDSAERANTVASYEAYLTQYPRGSFASLAQARIVDLKAPKPAPPPGGVSPAAAAAPTPAQAYLATRTPANVEGTWKGTDERGEGTMILERVGTRLKFRVELGPRVTVMSGANRTLDCEEIDVPADGKVSLWCRQSSAGDAQKLTGSHPNYTLSSAGLRFYKGGSFVLDYHMTLDDVEHVHALQGQGR